MSKLAILRRTAYLAVIPSALWADTVVLQDDFDDLAKWKDLSTAVSWSGSGSIFEISSGAARLKSFGGDVGSFTSPDGLKTFTALDHQFAAPIDRAGRTVTLSFRARWLGALNSSGEGNRFNVSFVHDYPAGGLDLTEDLRLSDYSMEWWGRPAYQVRIRGGSSTNAKAILQYGGGLTAAGEWEVHNSGGNNWWLPGFNSAPGGGSPGSPPSKGWTLTNSGLASLNWQDFTYVIGPSSQTISTDGTLRGTQNIADNVDSNPAFNVFDTLEGIRLYWRGSNGNLEIDSLMVSVSDPPGPALPDVEPLFVEIEDVRYFALRYTQPVGGTGTTGIDYTVGGTIHRVETQLTLSSAWLNGVEEVAPVGPPVDNGDGSETVVVRLLSPVADEPRQFARVALVGP